MRIWLHKKGRGEERSHGEGMYLSMSERVIDICTENAGMDIYMPNQQMNLIQITSEVKSEILPLNFFGASGLWGASRSHHGGGPM